jgi:hypothetical protein
MSVRKEKSVKISFFTNQGKIWEKFISWKIKFSGMIHYRKISLIFEFYELEGIIMRRLYDYDREFEFFFGMLCENVFFVVSLNIRTGFET